jgi:hypothetical protein
MGESAFDFMKIWTQGDHVSELTMKAALLYGLDTVVSEDCDVLSRLKVAPPATNPLVRWMEEWSYPSRITATLNGATMTFSGNLFGQAVTGQSVKKAIRQGTILERTRGGCQVKVTSIDGLSASVAAYGNSHLTDDPGPTEWDIIAEVWSDFREADEPRSLDRRVREVGTQIFAETFEIPKTRKNTRYAVIRYETEHQIAALLGKLKRQLAYAVLRSRPFHDGVEFVWGNKTGEPTMCGLCAWPEITQSELPNPNVHVNKGGQPLTKADLDNLVRHLWLDENADYSKGDWWIVCHPEIHWFIHDFDISHRRVEKEEKHIGFRVDEFHSKIGKTLPILSDRFMRSGALMVVNFAAFSYGYFADDFLDRKEIATQGRYQRWLISFQTYGVVARNPRANIGMICGLPSE